MAAAPAGTRMSEVDFARQFLGACDRSTPVRASDFVKDQKKYPARPPTLLPPLSVPYPSKQPSSFASDPSVVHSASSVPSTNNLPSANTQMTTVTITSLKPPKSTHVLHNIPLSTSILDLKMQLSSLLSSNQATAGSVSRIRLLHRRKPVSDSKIMKELLFPSSFEAEDEKVLETGLELSFMVSKDDTTAAGTLGTATVDDVKMTDADMGAVPQKITDTPEFWDDLNGFLLQRIKDENEAIEILRIFKNAFTASAKN